MAEAVATTTGLQQNARGRIAAFSGPSLALPRVLQHNVIGLGNATPLQPNGKRRRTTTADTAAGTTAGAAAGAATSSPRSSWITAQWRTVAEGRGKCLHCGEDKSINNITRLKNHLLACPEFLVSPQPRKPLGAEVTELPSFRQHIDQVKEVVHYFLHLQLPRELLLQHRAATAAAAATTTAATTVAAKHVELVQMSQTRFASLHDMLCSVQHNKSALRSVAISDSLGNDARSRNVIALVLNPDFWEKNEWIVGTLAPAAKLVEALQADAANLAHVHFGLMAVEDKLDKVTRSCPPAFQDDAFDLEQAWDQLRNFRDKHGALLPDQMRSAEDLAARLASSNGQGDDSAATQVDPPPLHQSIRYAHQLCTSAPHCIRRETSYMVKMKLSPNIFHPRPLRDPVTWWEWYGMETPVLQQVAQRVLSIPATSAGVERLFSVFKFIWSDRRNRLLMGRIWAMAYVYFNTRALKHQEQPSAADAAGVVAALTEA
ncbi:hypothetical protein QJQ45_008619 [Haematococcus lacustris]|nr:hypothetical protein QJQ45_008619 [Haematococcus lacustris]